MQRALLSFRTSRKASTQARTHTQIHIQTDLHTSHYPRLTSSYNMHFTSLISIAALALAYGAHGAPSAPIDPVEHVFSKETFTSSSMCRSTSWKFNRNAKAPLVSDCKKLEKDLRKHKKDGFLLLGWKPEDKEDDYLTILMEGTCNFGVSVIDDNGAPAPIAKGDIADLLRDAVKYYADGDHVSGVTGVVPCRANWNSFGEQQLGWRIFAM
ncbi:hypothetical protein F5B21DRAFT_496508 [Xylaria acuta]|nr:hypothetical protein F5B21DRAFT_496508 [Xylaria acuta]